MATMAARAITALDRPVAQAGDDGVAITAFGSTCRARAIPSGRRGLHATGFPAFDDRSLDTRLTRDVADVHASLDELGTP